MPIVRVLNKPKRVKKIPPPAVSEGKVVTKTTNSGMLVSQPAASRINYAVLTAKAQKAAATQKNSAPDPKEFLPGGNAVFEPPPENQRFQPDTAGLRMLSKQLNRDYVHSRVNLEIQPEFVSPIN